MSKYTLKNIPWAEFTWAEFAAMDEDGKVFLYEVEPCISYGRFMVGLEKCIFLEFRNTSKFWKQTLTKRPVLI